MARSKLESAFHELKQNPPAILAKTRKKSGASQANKQRVAIAFSKARAAGANIPDKSGANYVSRNELFTPVASPSVLKKGSERVPYKPMNGVAPTPELSTGDYDTGSKVKLNSSDRYGPSYVSGDDTVKAVTRDLNPVERDRQKNNRTRDQRTCLGRGKPSQPTTDAGAQTPTR